MTLGEKLQKLRNNKSMSQERFAEEMNVSRQAVSKWELNQSFPEMDKLIQISNYFHVTLDYLVKNQSNQVINKNECNQKGFSEKKELITSDLDETIMLVAILLALSSIRFMIMGDHFAGSVLAMVSSVIIVGVSIVKHRREKRQ